MRRIELDTILKTMLDSHTGISDLLFCVGRPLQVEVFGVLKDVPMNNLARLTSYHTEQIALALVGDDRRLIRELMMMGSCDCGYTIGDTARFRINIFRQRSNLAIVMRKLQSDTPSVTSLGLPAIFDSIVREKNGLILVTGATGSGKTTTLAAILNEINEKQAVHIITLEDPIEYVHGHKKSTFNQRELGLDFDNYANGLRAALRQAPKVILVGEIRDRETVEIALTAAETGHLVLSTLHTVDAGQSINRILGLFNLAEEQQIRLRLADTLRYIVSQRLVPKLGGGRYLLNEIMGNNLRVRETVALGEGDQRSFYDIIEANATFGWRTFDQCIANAYEAGAITEETANLYSTRKGRISQILDAIKKKRGVAADITSGLRLDTPRSSQPPPLTGNK